MRKLFILLLVVLLLVSFMAVLPVSAKHEGGFEGAQGEKWTNTAPEPGWAQNPGQSAGKHGGGN